MNKATVVTISKYKILFKPIRPTCFKLLWPAMPTTRVAKIKGATRVFIKRRKILAKRSISSENAGKSIPTSMPSTMALKIHRAIFFRTKAMKNRPRINPNRKVSNSPFGALGQKACAVKAANTSPKTIKYTLMVAKDFKEFHMR